MSFLNIADWQDKKLKEEILGEMPTPDTLEIEEITTAGGTTIPAGTLQEVLQAIADLADPAAP